MSAPAAGRAETVALLPATGDNVPADTLAAARDVFLGHLLATSRWSVTAASGPAPEGGWPPAVAVQRARQAGADVALTLHLTRLQGGTKARLATYRASDGGMAWFDEVSVEPGGLDGALQRLAQRLAAGRPAGGPVPPLVAAAPPPAAPPAAMPWPPPPGPPPPQPEPVGRGRRRADQSFGFAMVGAWASGAGQARPGDGTAQGVEAFGLYDTGAVLASVRLSYLGGANHQAAFGMGVHAPLAPGDVTPYLGGTIQYTWSRWWGAAWESGFTPMLGGGILLGRAWTVQVRAEVHWFYDLYLSQDAWGSFHGQGLAASLGMAF